MRSFLSPPAHDKKPKTHDFLSPRFEAISIETEKVANERAKLLKDRSSLLNGTQKKLLPTPLLQPPIKPPRQESSVVHVVYSQPPLARGLPEAIPEEQPSKRTRAVHKLKTLKQLVERIASDEGLNNQNIREGLHQLQEVQQDVLERLLNTRNSGFQSEDSYIRQQQPSLLPIHEPSQKHNVSQRYSKPETAIEGLAEMVRQDNGVAEGLRKLKEFHQELIQELNAVAQQPTKQSQASQKSNHSKSPNFGVTQQKFEAESVLNLIETKIVNEIVRLREDKVRLTNALNQEAKTVKELVEHTRRLQATLNKYEEQQQALQHQLHQRMINESRNGVLSEVDSASERESSDRRARRAEHTNHAINTPGRGQGHSQHLLEELVDIRSENHVLKTHLSKANDEIIKLQRMVQSGQKQQGMTGGSADRNRYERIIEDLRTHATDLQRQLEIEKEARQQNERAHQDRIHELRLQMTRLKGQNEKLRKDTIQMLRSRPKRIVTQEDENPVGRILNRYESTDHLNSRKI